MDIPRVVRKVSERKELARKMRVKGGEVVEHATFPNRFSAVAACGELLEDVYPYRVNVGYRPGGGKAWLSGAPRKPLDSYRRRPRKTLRQTTAVLGVSASRGEV